ncbi:MAG TPA: hypothetical protein PK156_14925, partial [Polyangium sp.]|nr:hypothetical protein [Polyangium sp.]
TRVAALTSLSRSLSLACTNGAVDVDRGLLERLATRALALRRGLGDLEQQEKRLRQESAQKPNDARLRAELASVQQNERRTLDTASREVAGKLNDAVRSIGALRTSLCSELCARGESSTKPVDLCAFSSPALANAAVISDESSVRALAAYIKHRFDALQVTLSSKQSLSLTEMASAEPGISPIFSVAEASSRVFDEQHTGLDVAAFTLGALDIGIKAVASLIIDRAKRESIVWLTRRLHEDVCGVKESQSDGVHEIRTYWFPTTCALTGGSVGFMQYGDADLMRTLRGAIAADVSVWHTQAVGLGVGATLWADGHIDGSLLSCKPNEDEESGCTGPAADKVTCARNQTRQATCRAAHEMRLSAAKLTRSLTSGANASLALYNFSGDVARINVNASISADARRFFSERLELLACAASIPYVFQEYGDLVRQTKPGKAEETKALLLAALTNSPACFSMLGRGFARHVCGGFAESTAGGVDSVCPPVDPAKPLDARLQPMLASQALGGVEKLSTILRWSHLVDFPADDLSTRWFAVVDAFRAYRLAAEEMAKVLPTVGISAAPVDLSGLGQATKLGDVFHAADVHTENTARLAERLPKLRVARASLVLARASLELALAFLATTERVLETQFASGATAGLFGGWYERDKPTVPPQPEYLLQLMFPGLESSTKTSLPTLRKVFVETTEDVRRLTESIETIEAVFADDWGRVVARVIAAMRADVARSCVSTQCQQACARGEGPCAVVATLARYSGLFAALAFETDADRVAAAIDAAASPGGGYRRKNVPGATTISLGSLAGLSGGTELRFGSYAGRYETGKVPYLAAPTLTLPLGIDFARGFGTHNLGVLVSAIDPAAYLQYDAAAGATLPGAQLVTALAPGAWLHASILDSPFTLGVYGVFRPGLRADASAFSTPGAHAFQFGVSAAVDVTLFDLFSSSVSVR